MQSYIQTTTEAKKEFMTFHKCIASNKLFSKFQTCIDVVLFKWIAKPTVFLVTLLPQVTLTSLVIIPLMLFKFIFVNIRLYIKTKGKYPLLSDYDFSMDEDDETDESYVEITNPTLLKCLRFIDGHIECEHIRFCIMFDAFGNFCDSINRYFDDDGRDICGSCFLYVASATAFPLFQLLIVPIPSSPFNFSMTLYP